MSQGKTFYYNVIFSIIYKYKLIKYKI